jgi:cytoskeletal protein CcmA (bactofilin family)
MAIFNKGYEAGGHASGGVSGDTVIAEGVRVEGDFKSDGNVVIEGEVKGMIATSQHLVVGPNALITAEVKAGSADIAGTIQGNLTVSGKLEIRGSAQLQGDVMATDLMIESGAIINGKISMDAERSQEEAAPAQE